MCNIHLHEKKNNLKAKNQKSMGIVSIYATASICA